MRRHHRVTQRHIRGALNGNVHFCCGRPSLRAGDVVVLVAQAAGWRFRPMRPRSATACCEFVYQHDQSLRVPRHDNSKRTVIRCCMSTPIQTESTSFGRRVLVRCCRAIAATVSAVAIADAIPAKDPRQFPIARGRVALVARDTR